MSEMMFAVHGNLYEDMLEHEECHDMPNALVIATVIDKIKEPFTYNELVNVVHQLLLIDWSLETAEKLVAAEMPILISYGLKPLADVVSIKNRTK